MIGLFDLHNEHLVGRTAAQREGDRFTVDAQQTAAQIEGVKIVERTDHRAGLALKGGIARAGIEFAPLIMKL